MKSFASDNTSGAHPHIIEAMIEVNRGTAPAYGDDPWTHSAIKALKHVFGEQTTPWFVFLGTAANVLGLKSCTQSHQAIICADTAHLNCDECGSPEAILGSKLLPVPTVHGKILPSACERLLTLRESVHQSYPRVLSITQSTECGTVYTIQELKAIADFCRHNDLLFHMDGARLSNAAAALGVSLKAITTDIGVDILSFGGTKNGLVCGEAVIFLNPEVGQSFDYYRKQYMQLGSKMRFVAAQFLAYLNNELWRENALAANKAAQRLAHALQEIEHVQIVHPVEVNAIFARLPKKVIAELQKTFYFYIIDPFDAEGYPAGWQMVRLMTSFNTTHEEIDEFANAIKACASFAS